MAIKVKRQTYWDGVISIYAVTNCAEPGDKPKEKLTLLYRLRFERRTVGYGRYYTAAHEQTEISELVRCPYRPDVSTQEVAIIAGREGEQYDIVQVQRPEDVIPPSMDLSLERRSDNYQIDHQNRADREA